MNEPGPVPPTPPTSANWEAFYASYRKPGYVPGFEITSKLGGGMFGQVYRAKKQSIGKDYAIKFLQVDDGEVRRALVAELEQLRYFAQIDHPNLVSIEDRGEVDGIPYLVMGFAGTETLRNRIRTDGVAPAPAEQQELLQYFLQACRGVSALHDRALVHFDLKPANVFLKGGVARVGDFGLSKLVTHSRGSLSMGRGTPYYMAPELLQRRGDRRSDVYSLGVILFEILCGKVPFTGDSEWEVLKQHETAPLAVPGHVGPRERAVLERCLAKDPAKRFASVDELLVALGAPLGTAAAALSDALLDAPQRSAVPPAAATSGAAAAGPGAGAAAGPGAPRSVPPPLPTEAIEGLKKAGVDALGHAKTLAKDASERARGVAERVSQDARAAWGDLTKNGRRTAKSTGAAMASGLKAVLVVGAVLACFVLVVGGLFLVRSKPTSVSMYALGDVVQSAGWADPMLVPVHVPDGLRGLVTEFSAAPEASAVDSVPGAPSFAERNVVAIEAIAERLRETAGRGRISVDTPTFQASYRASKDVLRDLRKVVDALAEGRALLGAQAELLRTWRSDALAMAALEVAQGRTDPAGLERAARLGEYLVEATGIHALSLAEYASMAPAARGPLHAAFGRLWTWALYERQFAAEGVAPTAVSPRAATSR